MENKMLEIVGVRFRDAGKVYYFDPNALALKEGDRVIVETSRGMEVGEVFLANNSIPESESKQPLKKVIRLVIPDDEKQLVENRKKEREALQICEEKVALHELDMKLIRAEYTFDRSKVLIYFTSDGRVDFRHLVRDLASVLRTRIELRQIGVRDEAKLLGGLGICGRAFCCSTFLNDFAPVSIKMAKSQGLSLNPTKISGSCGRLMCCLKYEQEAYEELHRVTPREGTIVKTPYGTGVITSVSLLSGMLTVLIAQTDGTTAVERVHRDEARRVSSDKGRKEKPKEFVK